MFEGFPHHVRIAFGNFERAVAAVVAQRGAALHGNIRDALLVQSRRGPASQLVEQLDAVRHHFGAEPLTEGPLPELDAVRYLLAEWRFYHGFRTDAGSPLRRPSLAVTSPTLDADGGNLGAVLATLKHIRGDTVDLDAAIDQAFPGARLDIPPPERDASFSMIFPEVPHRPFGPAELSDGTLQFLALLGALLAYRLPPFIALNEPEASLHPDMLEPLGRLIARAAERTQVWVVTHSERLAQAIARHGGVTARTVEKAGGLTTIRGLKAWGYVDEDAED